MKRIFLVIVVLAVVSIAGVAVVQVSRGGATTAAPAERAARALSAPQTPTDTQIRRGETLVKAAPSRPEGYNTLASAYMKKARETGDFGFTLKAETAIARSLEVAPENFGAAGLRAALLLTHHRFGEALEAARAAQQIRPDDPDLYGVMTDALVELGDYEGALLSAQAMMDLRPDGGSYARVAHLRALHGDAEGAAEAMIVAVQATNPQDPEGVAWCHVHLGNILMSLGKHAEAEREHDRALSAFPNHHLALGAKARARAIAGDYEQAIKLYATALERVPLADTAIALGDLHAKLGRADEAARHYEQAVFIERAGNGAGDSRQLALMWAEQNTNLDRALAIARRELAVRSDIYTRDALAWCLFRKGELAEAKAAIEGALRLGTRDAQIHYHAGMIEGALGNRASAVKHLRAAIDIRVTFDHANASFGVLQVDAARRALELYGGRA